MKRKNLMKVLLSVTLLIVLAVFLTPVRSVLIFLGMIAALLIVLRLTVMLGYLLWFLVRFVWYGILKLVSAEKAEKYRQKHLTANVLKNILLSPFRMPSDTKSLFMLSSTGMDSHARISGSEQMGGGGFGRTF